MNLEQMKSLPKSEQDKLYKQLNAERKRAKVVTYSATYGVGKKKLSRSTGMPEKDAQELIDGFWALNWGVRKFSERSLKDVKTVGGETWIKNPVSGFYHSLRYEKDAFSTINQSTGVYCFDNWLAFYLSRRPNIIGQFHDESINCIKKGQEKDHEETLKWAIGKVNEKLKLNIDLDVDVKFGSRYSDIH